VLWKKSQTKDEIQRLIIAELRTFAQCEKAWGIVVVPIVDDTGVATWTVSHFHRGQSSAYVGQRLVIDQSYQPIASHSILIGKLKRASRSAKRRPKQFLLEEV
jgi:hypothetical protein